MKVGLLGGISYEGECIGCAIAANEVPVFGGEILRTKNFNVSQDCEIPIPGFMIIGANRHIKTANELTLEEKEEFQKVVSLTKLAMKEVLDVEKITEVQEDTAKHFHVWLFPWYSWMKQGAENIESLRSIMKEARLSLNTESGLKEVENMSNRLREYVNSHT